MNALSPRTLLTLLALSTGTSALAASSTGNLSVSATVTANCTIDNATLNFGELVNGIADPNIAGTASVTVTCNALTPYTFTLGAGKYNSAGTYRMRNVDNTSAFVPYVLVAPAPGVITSASTQLTITGTVTRTGTLTAGTYEDLVVMTFSY